MYYIIDIIGIQVILDLCNHKRNNLVEYKVSSRINNNHLNLQLLRNTHLITLVIGNNPGRGAQPRTIFLFECSEWSWLICNRSRNTSKRHIFWQISLRPRCDCCRIGCPEVSLDVVSVVDEPPLVAAPRRQCRFRTCPDYCMLRAKLSNLWDNTN